MKLQKLRIAALVLQAWLVGQAQADDARKLYVVQLKDKPVATYAGERPDYPATRPVDGQRLDVKSAASRRYADYLQRKHDDVIRKVSSIQVVRHFSLALNGFSALMTEAEAAAIAAQPDVLSVQAGVLHNPSTVDSPRNLGLRDADGHWIARNPVTQQALKGEGVIVGVIDTGIWPESLSFADRVDAAGVPTFDAAGQQVYDPPANWAGACVAGQAFEPASCNNKLIGAKFFDASFKALGYALHWSDFAASPRDLVSTNTRGHGSHAASIAAGNEGVPVTMKGGVAGVMSGMAPRARIASYKACWGYRKADGSDSSVCPTSDVVSAVEEAMQDGVDVLSVSISGGETVDNAMEQAFLSATTAGIFVAAAAGNSGPDNTVAHVGPWTTTVASSSIDRDLRVKVVLGDGTEYFGSSMNSSALGSAPLIAAADAGLPGVDRTKLKTCQVGADGSALLDAAKVGGKIVVCLRGYTNFDVKSNVVRDAGGVGMVIQEYGNSPATITVEYSLPTLLVSSADGDLVMAYARTQAPTASMAGVRFVKNAPVINTLSSRGPNRFDANVLKPDVAAPGHDIYASASEALNQADHDAIVAGNRLPRDARMIKSGTSMATPHVGGMAALFKEGYPGWSPAQIKSALMTTAQPTLDDGLPGMQNGLLPWAKGAGRIHAASLNPGLTYDLTNDDYVRYLCKVKPTMAAAVGRCDAGNGGVGTLDETYNLNQPAITLAALDAQTVVRRTVTNVGDAESTYDAAVVAPPGYTAVLNRQQLVFTAGQPATQAFTVTLTPLANAARGAWAYGSLTWTDQHGHTVRSLLTVRRPLLIEIPAAIAAEGVNGASGSRMMSVKTGYAGTFAVDRAGLVAPTVSNEIRLTPEPMDVAALTAACSAGGADLPASISASEFVMPADAVAARFALRSANAASPASDNFNLVVVKTDGSWSGASTDAGAEEAVNLPPLPAGTYRACVHAASTGSGAQQMTTRLSSWIATAGSGSGLSVAAPVAAQDGATAVVTAAWKGLQAGQQYLGGLRFRANGAVQGGTPLFIDTRR